METTLEFISIVIPVYNSGEWIERCLNSVRAAIDENCEVIIVDDGSTDDSLEKARAFEDEDPRFVVIADEHRGPGPARKTGVEASSGDSVILINSDDILPANSIAEMRQVSGPDVEIVIGNRSIRNMDGKSELTLNGATEYIDSAELVRRILLGEIDFDPIGKKIARHLFFEYFWDCNPIYVGLFHRALWLSIACAAKGRVVVSPAIHAYTYIKRPWSLSAMLRLRADAIGLMWESVCKLPLPEKELVIWGLDMMEATMLSRGIYFEDDFPPAVALRELSAKYELDDRHRYIASLLGSKKKRLAAARKAVRNEPISLPAPHLSFIIACSGHSVSVVKRTIESILDTGFRNIEILLVDEGDDPEASIEYNALSVNYLRVMLKKHIKGNGHYSTQLTGLKAASGYAVCFLRPGDVIDGPAILEALRRIDNDSDICFMATRTVQRWTGMNLREFDPTACVAINDGPEQAFDSLLGRGAVLCGVSGFIARRSFLEINHFSRPDLEYGGRIIMMLEALSRNPRISSTGEVAIRQMAQGANYHYSRHCHNYARMANSLLEMLETLSLDNPERRQIVADGVDSVLVNGIALELTLPLIGKRRGRRLARKMIADRAVVDLYNAVGLPLPDVDTLMERATTHVANHRRYLTACKLFNIPV